MEKEENERASKLTEKMIEKMRKQREGNENIRSIANAY
jgi:hypothetical protein